MWGYIPYPDSSSWVVINDTVSDVEVKALGQSSLDLQEDLRLELGLGPEDDVHVVAGCHHTLGSEKIKFFAKLKIWEMAKDTLPNLTIRQKHVKIFQVLALIPD